jgi:HEAT repeat protein
VTPARWFPSSHGRAIGILKELAANPLATSETREAALEQLANELGSLDAARAEATLIELLSHPAHGVRRAAAISPGAVGTVRAVEPLLPLTKGITTNDALKIAARHSIRRIQSRLGEAADGQLSLMTQDEQTGALSLSTDGGELSVTPDRTKEPA